MKSLTRSVGVPLALGGLTFGSLALAAGGSQSVAFRHKVAYHHIAKRAPLGPRIIRHADTLSCPAAIAAPHLLGSSQNLWMDNVMANNATHDGWMEGDGNESVILPGGRIAWFNDDSWVHIKGRNYFLHNVLTVQNATSGPGSLHAVVHWGWSKRHYPIPFMTRGLQPGHFYWNDGAIVNGNTLYVLYSNMYYPNNRPSSLGWNFVNYDTVIAKFNATTLRIEGYKVIPNMGEVQWGGSISQFGGYDYIYTGGYPNGYVARTPVGHMLSPWQYRDGSGWTTDSNLMQPFAPNIVSTQYTVNQLGNVYVLTTKATDFASADIYMYFGCSPTGPFINPIMVYQGQTHGGKFGTAYLRNIITYGAEAHTQLVSVWGDSLDSMIISFNVNVFGVGAGSVAPTVIRPRYARVLLSFG